MLISFYKNRSGEYDEEYSSARRKIDILCGLIISGRLNRDSAQKKYDEIEKDLKKIKKSDIKKIKKDIEDRIKDLWG